MVCLLCLEESDNSLKMDRDDGMESDIPFVLDKYFHFCFDVSNSKRSNYENDSLINTLVKRKYLFSVSVEEDNRWRGMRELLESSDRLSRVLRAN